MFRRGLNAVRSLLRHPLRLVAIVALLIIIGGGAAAGGGLLWGQYHYRAAERKLAEHRPDLAIGHLNQYLRLWPRSGQAHLLAARASRRAGNLTDAEAHLHEARQLLGMTDAIDLERALLTAQRGDTEVVVTFLKRQVEEDHPDSAMILEAVIRGYMKNYRLTDAAFCIELLLARQPDNPIAYMCRGWVLEKNNRQLDAIPDYRQAVELNPDNDEARLWLANALAEANLASEALPELDVLLQKRPGDPLLLVIVAHCQDALGRQEEAAKTLDTVLAEHPDYAPALSARGKLARQAGDLDQAMKWLHRAIELEPGAYKAQYHLYLCLKQLGREKEAQEQFARMKQMEKDMARIHEIVTKNKMGEAPDDPALHVEMGEIFLRSGEVREGLRWLYNALHKDPKYKPAHEALADHFERTGDRKRAAEHRALARDPNPAATGPAPRP